MRFADSFDFAQHHLDWRFAVKIGWSFMEKLVPSVGKPMRDACKTLDDYVYSLIDERQRTSAQGPSESHVDLLGLFMKAGDDKDCPLDRGQLKDAAMNMIIAGR